MEEDRNGKITGKYARQCFAKEIYLQTEKKKKRNLYNYFDSMWIILIIPSDN